MQMDVGFDPFFQLVRRLEANTVNRLSLQRAEPDFYLVQPGSVGRCKDRDESRVLSKELGRLPASMNTAVVENQVDFAVWMCVEDSV